MAIDPTQTQTSSVPQAPAAPAQIVAHRVEPVAGRGWVGWVSTTDHKRIGVLYLVTAFAFMALGGVEALLMRTQLAEPNNTLLTPQVYNQVLTMHGTTMVFLVIMPLWAGFANYFVPLQVGARDMAFPRLNALSYWLYLAGGTVFYASVFFSAPEAGWTAYTPLSSGPYIPGNGTDAWIFLIHLTGASSILGALNITVTIANMRARGMGWARLPLFCWSMLAQAIMIILTLPVIAGAVTLLLTDRHFGTCFYDPSCGGSSLLWQHLFWFFGHPEVYIMILPAFGVISEVLPVFARKPIFGYKAIAASSIAIAFLSMLVWAHHMFATPLSSAVLVFFMLSSMAIAVPTGREGAQLGGHAVSRLDRAAHPAVLRRRVPRPLHPRRHHRRDARDLPHRPPGHRHLLRRRALPLRPGRRLGVGRDGRGLLLVSEDHRAHALRADRQALVLAAVRRLPGHLPHPALARALRDAQAHLHLQRRQGLGDRQPHLHRRRLHPRRSGSCSPSPTCSGACAMAAWPAPTRGRATRWSGSPPPRPRRTTSTPSPGCDPSSR